MLNYLKLSFLSPTSLCTTNSPSFFFFELHPKLKIYDDISNSWCLMAVYNTFDQNFFFEPSLI